MKRTIRFIITLIVACSLFSGCASKKEKIMKEGNKEEPIATKEEEAYLNSTKLTLKSQQTFQLEIVGATAKEWKSEDDTIAIVDTNGCITALKEGTTKIVCLTEDEKTYECELVVDDVHVHQYTCKVTKEADCSANGIQTYTCVCGSEYTENIEKKAHSYEVIKTVNATCEKEGSKEYQCKKCKTSYKESIPKMEHDYTTIKSVDATCAETGYKEYKCNNCNDISKETLKKLSHDYKIVSSAESTCKTNGYKEYKCSRCSASYKETVPVNSNNHNYASTSDATYKYYKCSDCGNSYKEYMDKTYTIDLGNGKTTTVVGHYETDMAEEIFAQVNEYRASNGLATLGRPSSALQNAANIRGYEIVHTFEHYGPNGERALLSFLDTTNCCSENIAKYQRSATAVMEAWKASKPHDANMRSPYPKYLAVSVFAEKGNHGNYFYHFVQFFGW